LTTSFLHIVRDRSLVRTDREVTIVEDRTRERPRHGVQHRVRQFTLNADVRGRFRAEEGAMKRVWLAAILSAACPPGPKRPTGTNRRRSKPTA